MNLQILTLFFLGFSSPLLSRADNLRLDDFIQQVKGTHTGFRAAQMGSAAAQDRSEEGTSLISPSLFGSAQYYSDAKKSPFFPYNKLVTGTYTLGLSQQFTFGTQAKVSYMLTSYDYQGLRPLYYEGRPQIELVQPIWKNWLGAETKANQEQLEATALATHFGDSFQTRTILLDAEIAYWRLVSARENVAIQKDAVARSEKIYEWNNKRARLQLADASDPLQAQAALEVRRLQLESAMSEERSAARSFNLARGLDSATVTETLSPPEVGWIESQAMASPLHSRDDVKAAEQAQRAAIASARIGAERNKPTVELYGLYALNSNNPESGPAFSDSFGTSHPTSTVGVRFSTPLDFGTVSQVQKAYRTEQQSAELSYQRKLLEERQDWNDLVQKFEDAKTQLRLSRTIEKAQEKKLLHERDRLSRGRSTTYQVLVFEQDFSSAQLSRIQAQSTVLQILARFRLFNEGVPYEPR